MILKIVIVLISILVILVNLLLWWRFLPRIVDKRISRFQSDLVSKYYDEIEVMYRKCGDGGMTTTIISRY